MNRVLQMVVLLSFTASTMAAAGPVIAQPAEGADASGGAATEGALGISFTGGSLFDDAGLPLLLLSAPTYIQLGWPSAFDGAGGFGQNFFADPGAASVGAAIDSAMKDAIQDALSGDGSTPSSMSNVSFQFDPNSTPLAGQIGSIAIAVAEPATLLLLAPAAALAVRRYRRRRDARR